MVPYIELPQCEGSDREEITNVLTDVSDSGKIRGRIMYSSPTYRLTMVHSTLEPSTFKAFDDFWAANFNQEFEIVWVADGETYQGIPESSPSISISKDGYFDISTTFLVKKVS